MHKNVSPLWRIHFLLSKVWKRRNDCEISRNPPYWQNRYAFSEGSSNTFKKLVKVVKICILPQNMWNDMRFVLQIIFWRKKEICWRKKHQRKYTFYIIAFIMTSIFMFVLFVLELNGPKVDGNFIRHEEEMSE